MNAYSSFVMNIPRVRAVSTKVKQLKTKTIQKYVEKRSNPSVLPTSYPGSIGEKTDSKRSKKEYPEIVEQEIKEKQEKNSSKKNSQKRLIHQLRRNKYMDTMEWGGLVC